MTDIFKIALGIVLAVFIMISATLGGTYYMVTVQTEKIQTAIKEDFNKALKLQKEEYEKKISVILSESNQKAIDIFEKSLKSAENTYRVYTSEYVKQMADRAALAKFKLQQNPTAERAKEQYDDLMATMETENYQFGLGHNVIKDVNKKSLTEKYESIRKRLKENGLSKEEIDKIFLDKIIKKLEKE